MLEGQIEEENGENLQEYSGDYGLVQAPQPNAGRTEKSCENQFFRKKKNYLKFFF